MGSSKDDDTETVAISEMTYAEVIGSGSLLKQGYLLKRPSRQGSINLGLTKQRFIVLQTDRLLWFKRGEAQDCILGEIPISEQTEVTRHAPSLITAEKITVKTGGRELDLMASKVGELDEWSWLIQEQVAALKTPRKSVAQKMLAKCANGTLLDGLGRTLSECGRSLSPGSRLHCSAGDAAMVVGCTAAALLCSRLLPATLLAVLGCWVLPLLLLRRCERTDTAATIAACLQIAEEASSASPASASADLPPLSSERSARVSKLFLLFSPSSSKPIDATDLAQVVVTQGPRETKVLEGLQAMDYDGDGKLTFGEMSRFFAAAGAKMSDDEFGFLVDDMVATCESALRAKLAVAAHF